MRTVRKRAYVIFFGGVAICLYLIGVVAALRAYPVMYDSYSTVDLKIGAGGALLIVGLLLITAATALGFLGIDGAKEDSARVGSQEMNMSPVPNPN